MHGWLYSSKRSMGSRPRLQCECMMRLIRLIASSLLPGCIILGIAHNGHAGSRTVRWCEYDPKRTCVAGEYATVIEVPIPNGNYVQSSTPSCPSNDFSVQGNRENFVVGIVRKSSQKWRKEIRNSAGSLNDLVSSRDYTDIPSPSIPGFGGAEHAVCSALVAAIPHDAQVQGVHLGFTDAKGTRECKPSAECEYARFIAPPNVRRIQLLSRPGIQVVDAFFMNWSHDRNRIAWIAVFYSFKTGEMPKAISPGPM
ncbi:hypothetical protein M2351_006874 [Azospirillum canadense]|nr:hypothetical protein [Azospirillum canadense]